MSNSLQTRWTVAYQAPPFMGFSRQEYWSGLPFPFPGDLPNPGIKPRSPAFQAGRCFNLWATREAPISIDTLYLCSTFINFSHVILITTLQKTDKLILGIRDNGIHKTLSLILLFPMSSLFQDLYFSFRLCLCCRNFLDACLSHVLPSCQGR